jgi:hypothetical protein
MFFTRRKLQNHALYKIFCVRYTLYLPSFVRLSFYTTTGNFLTLLTNLPVSQVNSLGLGLSRLLYLPPQTVTLTFWQLATSINSSHHTVLYNSYLTARPGSTPLQIAITINLNIEINKLLLLYRAHVHNWTKIPAQY